MESEINFLLPNLDLETTGNNLKHECRIASKKIKIKKEFKQIEIGLQIGSNYIRSKNTWIATGIKTRPKSPKTNPKKKKN